MSTIREHVETLRDLLDTKGWLTDRFHQSAAIFCAGHLHELEAALPAIEAVLTNTVTPADMTDQSRATATAYGTGGSEQRSALPNPPTEAK